MEFAKARFQTLPRFDTFLPKLFSANHNTVIEAATMRVSRAAEFGAMPEASTKPRILAISVGWIPARGMPLCRIKKRVYAAGNSHPEMANEIASSAANTIENPAINPFLLRDIVRTTTRGRMSWNLNTP